MIEHEIVEFLAQQARTEWFNDVEGAQICWIFDDSAIAPLKPKVTEMNPTHKIYLF